jgi:hypothetical protein
VAEFKLFANSPLAKVPVVFTSGKALPHRRAFIRAVTKSGGALTMMVQGELNGLKGTQVIPEVLQSWRVWDRPVTQQAGVELGEYEPGTGKGLFGDVLNTVTEKETKQEL